MIKESRASVENNENYFPQRALRCINFERLQNIEEGEVVKAICESSNQDLSSSLNSYVFFDNRGLACIALSLGP